MAEQVTLHPVTSPDVTSAANGTGGTPTVFEVPLTSDEKSLLMMLFQEGTPKMPVILRALIAARGLAGCEFGLEVEFHLKVAHALGGSQ